MLLRKQRTPAQYEEKIRRVIGDVDRLNAMLDQLLQLARLESGHIPINRTPVALDVLFRALADKWQPRLRKKNMELRLQIPSAVILTTDDALLNIILDNLLGNAIKYGHSGGYIDCTWQPENTSLIIRDEGPGISPEQLPHIFNRFYRADDSRSYTIPGAGLGLSIAKKLADLLDIRLEFPTVPFPLLIFEEV